MEELQIDILDITSIINSISPVASPHVMSGVDRVITERASTLALRIANYILASVVLLC